MIDIIIPAYNSHDTIEQTLLSICLQNIKQMFNVYIVNDYSIKDYREIVKKFSKYINVTELKLDKNSGPGIARQYGIDHSYGEYIVFIDGDDLFMNCFAVENLYNRIYNKNADMAVGTLVDETNDGYYDWINHPGCLHGKIYSRKFLEREKIRFNDTRFSEDDGFNKLCLIATDNYECVNSKVYLYRNNIKSVTNNCNTFIKKIYWFIYNMVWVIDESEKRNYDKIKISVLWYRSFLYIYQQYVKYYKEENSYLIIDWASKLEKMSAIYESNITEKMKVDLYLNYFDDINPDISLREFRNLFNGTDKNSTQ